jgi:probable HAF family extracellular repeat protein
MSTTEMRRPFAGAVALAAVCVFVVACGGGGHTKNTPPTAAFTATPATGVSPQPVALDASASIDREGPIAAYAWDFGDGSATATGVTASHVYSSPGSFTVTLTVTDRKRATGTASSTITVKANTPPTASFTATPIRGLAPLTVAFNASASSDPDGSIVSYAWTFGDGATGSGSVTQHTYVTSGRFQVTLKVTDDRGGTGSATASSIVMSGMAAEWYSVTEIPSLDATSVESAALNNLGMVTGTLYFATTDARHAFVFDGRNTFDLGTFGGRWSYGNDVNDLGDIVVWLVKAEGSWTSLLIRNGTVQDLGTLVGLPNQVTGINNAGQIAGTTLDKDGYARAFLYENGQVHLLGTLGGGDTRAFAISENGTVAGESQIAPYGQLHAFIYSGGTMSDISTNVGTVGSSAFGVNDVNDAIGIWSFPHTQMYGGFLYRGGVMRWLVPGGSPAAINNAGVVVGNAYYSGQGLQAFVWDETKGIQNLNGLIDPSLGWSLVWADDINEVGQIVAIGQRLGGPYVAVLLTPAVKP